MKAIKFLSLGILATMIASCSSDEVALTKEVTARITGNIGSTLKTRAQNNEWEKGDQIGLFVTNAAYNAQGVEIYRTFNNSAFVTETAGNTQKFSPVTGGETIKYPSTGAPIFFKAYYPYTSGVTFANPEVVIDWTDQSVPQKLDYLISDNPSEKMALEGEEQPSVELTFRHIFSRIVLTIIANSDESQIQTNELAGITVSGAGMNVTTTLNVLSGAITNGETALDDAIEFNVQTDGQKASAIICPEINFENTKREVTFTLENGRAYKWEIPSDMDFESGKSYNWNIKLRGEGLATGELIGTIVNWEDVNKTDDIDLDFE